MIYLKEFDTQEAYDAAKDGLLTPNVSLITETGEVKYLKGTTPVEHEYIDLGLPSGTLWATMNIGASSITDTGLYYQWGDTQGYAKDDHDWDNEYKWGNKVEYQFTFTKYNSTDKKNILDNEDDAAIVSWGNGWHMPTKDNFDELIDSANTTHTYVTNYLDSGVDGLLITSKTNSNSIFLPSIVDGETVWYNAYHTTILDEYFNSECVTLQFFDDGDVTTDDEFRTQPRVYPSCIRPIKDA